MSKSYGRIAHEVFVNSTSEIAWEQSTFKNDWEDAANAIIKEYTRHQPALVGAEITEAYLWASKLHLVGSPQWCSEVASHLNWLFKNRRLAPSDLDDMETWVAKEEARIKAIRDWPKKDEMSDRLSKAVAETTRNCSIPLDQPEDEREAGKEDEKQPETEAQYQERLLRALRDFG